MATRPSQEDSPHFPTTPSPFPPVPPVPPEKVFLALLTHRPAIYRDPWANHLEGFLISFHCIALHCISRHVMSRHVISFHLFIFVLANTSTSAAVATIALLNVPETVYKGVSPFPHFSLPMLMMEPRAFTPSLTRVSGYRH